MKIVAIIPIKLNNERLKNKNLKKFCNGVPLCNYIFKTFLSIKEIDEVYVFCSNEKIKKYIPIGIKYLKRDIKFDTSSGKMNDILFDFAKKVPADIYIMSHCTSPFIKAISIQKGLNELIKHNSKYDSAFSGKILQDFIWKDNKPFNYKLNSIPRTQDLPQLIVETSGFYAYKRNVIINKHRRIGDHPYIVNVDNVEAIDIDEQEDFDLANKIIRGSLK